MSFPKSFLIGLAREKQLADRETEVFLALFGDEKTRLEIAEQLHVQESAVSTCLSGVYRKFGISGNGPVKESRLKDELKQREQLWQKQQSTTPIDPSSTPPLSNETWIDQVRSHCGQKILSQHSRMRLLSGEEIGVDQLYVDVWLLNRSPRTFQVSESKLLKTFDLRNDRLGLGDRIQRNPGFEVANDKPKLVILGKPGAGKTTFLKHLAVDWCNGKFQPESIAVLIELRRIRDGRWNLIEVIDQELGLKNWYQFTAIKQQIQTLKQTLKQQQQLELQQQKDQILKLQQQENQILELQQQLAALSLEKLLKGGKLLLLMDGLDEVPTDQLRLIVQRQLEQFAQDYPKNRLILTCRTQIMGVIPTGFTSVEVADFNEEQVQQFVQNWFTANGKSRAEAVQQWEMLYYAIGHNLALKELTATPVLLSLMCLVLHDQGEIPTERDWLYQKGIKLLLSRWNDTKQIEGWEIGTETYRQLNIEQKEALLTEIAARKFENPRNFVLFQEDEIAVQITQFLKLANPKEGIAVLKAIEAQHGLLIERADELWSFSHLTFQEYFTIQWLTKLTSEELAEKIAKKQWQEAVQQIVKSQQPADRLIKLIKQAIDRSIAEEPELQTFLAWVLQKSASIQANYKLAAIRAFYFSCALALALALDLDLALARTLALSRARDLALSFDHAHAHVLDLALAHALSRDLDFNSELVNKLIQLRIVLPITTSENFQQWWQVNGNQWTEQLRQVMIEHRNIGHDWQFTGTQNQQLKSYYEVNKFLVELIKIDGAVSDGVRDEIEDSLLLPWEELQRRQR